MSWWDGSPIDRVRLLRDSLRADRSHYANAPLSPNKKRLLAESIAGQAEQLQKLLRLKQRAEKRRTQVRGNNR